MLVKHYSSSTRTFTLTCDKAAAVLTSTGLQSGAGGLKCVTSAGGAAELSVLKCVTSTGALEQQHYQYSNVQWSSRAVEQAVAIRKWLLLSGPPRCSSRLSRTAAWTADWMTAPPQLCAISSPACRRANRPVCTNLAHGGWEGRERIKASSIGPSHGPWI